MYAIGLDLGGTKIAAGVVAADGRVLGAYRVPTPVEEGPAAVIDALEAAVRQTLTESGIARAEVSAVGLASPGPVDRAGVVWCAPNLKWVDVPLRGLLSPRLPWPLEVVNDATAAGLAEARFGAGRGAELMLYLTVSTGIGGGIVYCGQAVLGAHGSAAEFGHQVLDPDGPLCGCGRRGCLEALAAGPATARRAAARLARGESSLLGELSGGDPQRITAVLVGEAAARSDAVANAVLDETAHWLGLGVANLVAAFDPDRVVVGGGLANLGERLLGPVREVVRREVMPPAGLQVEIVTAALGPHSGVIGAACFAAGTGFSPPNPLPRQ